MKSIYIFCDESKDKGSHFSNFYGGLLVPGHHYQEVKERLQSFKTDRAITGELKWNKIAGHSVDHYIAFSNLIIDLIEEDKAKARILFTQNQRIPLSVANFDPEFKYTKLYYQFIKHAFGLKYCNGGNRELTEVFLNFDLLPVNSFQKKIFKDYLANLPRLSDFSNSQLSIKASNIAEYDSKTEILGQAIDVLLGSMQFKLNRLHEQKNPETNKIGKKTKLKLTVYKNISARVIALCRTKGITGQFNAGISTGLGDNKANTWLHAYRHWRFDPYER